MLDKEDKQDAPYCPYPGSAEPKNYPQKFVYPSEKNMPKCPPGNKKVYE